MREIISACITVGNEEANIRRCLESVKWVDEIVVVDSFSTDQTPAICRDYTELVFQHRWLGYIGQKNLIKDLATGTWILFVDADEEVSAQLRDEILEELDSGRADQFSGYEFPRMVRFLGRWIRHGDWYPDIKLRLVRKAKGHCGGKEPHDRMIVDGAVKRLKGVVHHYTYNGINDQLDTMNRFSSISARTQYQEGRKLRISDMALRPIWRFVRCYFVKGGFLDGLPGLIIAMTASYAVFAKYAKLWELCMRARQDTSPPQP